MKRQLVGLVSAISTAFCVGSPVPVAAHALPIGLSLSWPDGAAEAPPWVLTSRGVVFTNGQSAALRCNEAFFVNTSALPQLWAQGGFFALKTQEDVLHSDDHGCSLVRAVGLPNVALGGYAVLPDASETMLVATSRPGPMSGLFASTDHGVSFSLRYDNEDNEAFTELRAAPSSTLRVYASGFRVDVATKQIGFLWAVSQDGGRTFTRAFLPTERVLLGVAARDPEVVFAYEKLAGNTEDVAILQSDDGGTTFTDRLHLAGRPVFTSSASEDTLWLGATETAGLFTSRDGGRTFVPSRPELQAISCLAHHDGALHICARHFPIELGVWSQVSEQSPLFPVVLFGQVTAPLECPDDRGVCAASWQDWTAELLSAAPTADAGSLANGGAVTDMADAAPTRAGDAAPPSVDAALASPTKSTDSGCAVSQAADGKAGRLGRTSLTLGLLALALWIQRARRRQPMGLW